MEIKTLRFLCTGATILGAAIGLGGSLLAAQKEEMLLDEKIDKKLAERENENEEES